MELRIISLDFACTLFWEPGCDPRFPVRYARETLYKILDKLREKGYSINSVDDPYVKYRAVFDDTYRSLPGEVWTKFALLKFLRRIGVEPHEDLLDLINRFYVEERSTHFTPDPCLRTLLPQIKARGYILVLTTAIPSHDIVALALKRNGLDSFFDMIYSTHLVGLKKDNPLFYSQLIETIGVEPHEAIHIGDDLNTDIYPARSVGLNTVYYGWRTMCRAVDPQPCILSLMEILDYI